MKPYRILAGQTNNYLIGNQDAYILVDAGPFRSARTIMNGIVSAGVQPDQINLVFISHAHLDHYGSASEIQSWCRAPIATHKQAPEFSKIKHYTIPPAETFRASIIRWLYLMVIQFREIPSIEADILLKDGDTLAEFGIDGHVIETPGHSPDSLSLITSEGDVFAGDLFVNYTVPSQPLYKHSHSDWKNSFERIKNKNPRMVYIGHGEPFSGSLLENLYPPRYQLRWWIR